MWLRISIFTKLSLLRKSVLHNMTAGIFQPSRIKLSRSVSHCQDERVGMVASVRAGQATCSERCNVQRSR